MSKPKLSPTESVATAAAALHAAASNAVEKPEPVAPQPSAPRTRDRPTDAASRAAWKRERRIALGDPHSQ